MNYTYDAFLSYQWNIQPEISRFYQYLREKFQLKVFFDKNAMQYSESLVQQMREGINECKVFICFITIAYSKSQNCNAEFNWAHYKQKKIMYVMMEKVDNLDLLGNIGFDIVSKLRLNMYEDLDGFNNYSGEKFDSLIQWLKNNIDCMNYQQEGIINPQPIVHQNLTPSASTTTIKIDTADSQIYEDAQSGHVISPGSWNYSYINTVSLKDYSSRSDKIFDLELMPNGYVISGTYDGHIDIWDSKTSKIVKSWKVKDIIGPAVIACLKLMPSGELVTGLNCLKNEKIKVWNIDTGGCISKLKGHKDIVTCLEVLPNGDLVSGSADQMIKIWKITQENCLKTLQGHSDRVSCLKIMPDGELISGSEDTNIVVWDVINEKIIRTLVGHQGAVNSLDVSQAGELISGSSDARIKLWNIKTGNCLKTIPSHFGGIHSIKVMPSGELACGLTKLIEIWNLKLDKCVCFNIRDVHLDKIKALKVLPTGELVSGSFDKKIKIWKWKCDFDKI